MGRFVEYCTELTVMMKHLGWAWQEFIVCVTWETEVDHRDNAKRIFDARSAYFCFVNTASTSGVLVVVNGAVR